jgi:predicted enzyme related to lactoylglutathione lyase
MHEYPGFRRFQIHGAIITACVLALAIGSTVTAQQSSPATGTFVGAVLLTDDAEAASVFYGELFGWDMEKAKDGGFAVRHKGSLVASISPLQNAKEDIEESFWLVGLAVNSLDQVLRATGENGGKVFIGAERFSDYGRFAVIADPEEAPLMLVQSGIKPIGGTSGPGSWVWAELWTNDPADAAEFYASTFGLEYGQLNREGGAYDVLMSKGVARAGMVAIPDEYENVEPGWAPYVAVADLAAALKEVERLGGTLVFSTTEHPAEGAVALIKDPTGAVLFLYQIASRQEATQ